MMLAYLKEGMSKAQMSRLTFNAPTDFMHGLNVFVSEALKI